MIFKRSESSRDRAFRHSFERFVVAAPVPSLPSWLLEAQSKNPIW
jgi:hypothetical protein